MIRLDQRIDFARDRIKLCYQTWFLATKSVQNYSRERRKVGDSVVDGDTRREANTCSRANPKKIWHRNKKTPQKVYHEYETSDQEMMKIYAPLLTLTPLTALLYTAPVPCSRSLSPSVQRSITFAPSTANSMIFLITSRAISAAT